MKIHDETMYGEHLGDLLPGLKAFCDAASMGDDGSWRSSVTLDRAVGNPLVRALMRVEAELLVEDADAIGTDSEDRRTSEQRGADALVRLAEAIGEAGSN